MHGFERRVELLREEWHAVCSSLDEPTSSLQEFETALDFALISLQDRPPSFRDAHDRAEKALRVVRTETFPVLDSRNLDRLLRCVSVLSTLDSQARALRAEVLRRMPTGGLACRVFGRSYTVPAAEIRQRLSGVAHALASREVATGRSCETATAMLRKLVARAQQVRQRYLMKKAALLKQYMETGTHRTKMPEAVRDVVAELRFRQMQKSEINELVSHFGTGSRHRQLERFVGSLVHEREYVVYTTVPGVTLDSARISVPDLQLVQGPQPLLGTREVGTPLQRQMLQVFGALAHDSVVAESIVTASNPAEAVARARIRLDAAASLGAYLNLGRGSREVAQEAPSLVYEGDHLARAAGIGAAMRDGQLVLHSSREDELASLLEAVGADSSASSRAELQERVVTSMHWYMLGVTSRTPEERYVDHAIALEVLLSGSLAEREKSRVVADRATKLCRILKSGREEYKTLIRRLYKSRNLLVHAGLHRSRSLLQDSRDLEYNTLLCLFSAVDGIKTGCSSLVQLIAHIEAERVAARARRLSNSRLLPNTGAPFRGRLLLVSGKKLADVTGTLTLMDEGTDGYAYHELDVAAASYKKPLQITSADDCYFSGEAAGHPVELRDGCIVGRSPLFFVVVSGTNRFTYRAFDGVAFA